MSELNNQRKNQEETPRVKEFREKMKDENNRILAEYSMGFKKSSSFFGRHHPIILGSMTYNEKENKDDFTETYDTYIFNEDNESLKSVDNILNPDYKKSTDYFLGAYISVVFMILWVIALLLIIFVWKPSNTSIITIISGLCLGIIAVYPLLKIAVSVYPFYIWKKTRSNNKKTE